MKKLRLLIITSLFASLISFNSFAQATDRSVSIKFGNMTIADRNAGAKSGGIARNYSNIGEVPMGKRDQSFRGGRYIWEKAQTVCPNGWRLPTREELETISNAMQFSDGGAYLKDGDGNRCYFPLSGDSYSPSYEIGSYWSSTEDGDSAWGLRLNVNSCSVSRHYYKSLGFSVRCVK